MVLRIFGHVAAIASILALAFIDASWTWWRVLLVAIGILGAVFIVICEIRDYRKKKVVVCKSTDEINQYMYSWVKTPGVVNIFSRDLTWVTEEIKHHLFSRGSDISICAEKDTPLTKELASHGVKIYLYGDWGYAPQSRFTMIRANKPDKQIAIAKSTKQNKKIRHEIYETTDNFTDEWLKTISSDLFEIVKAINASHLKGSSV